MKIYDWRRFLTFILMVFLLIVIFLACKNRVTYEVESTFSYYVTSNETLWSIAGKYRPEHMDIREYIDLLEKENNIDNCIIYPGQELKILKMKEVRK